MGERKAAFTCTKEVPWKQEMGLKGGVSHPDAVCVYDGGWEQEYERYECPHCGTRFTVELAQ